jgi:anaerobic selenocysteine-containing dehydrogenase
MTLASEVRHSVCALDCPDCCSLLVNFDGVKGNRLRGNPEHTVTKGFLCGKVAQYLEREYSPDRLLYPQIRIGAKGEGKFARIGWEDALSLAAAKLGEISAAHGPESILPYSYGGTLGYLNGGGMDRRFFHRIGASRLDRTICASAGSAGLTATQGVRYGTEPEQFAKSKLIIAWGANIMGTNVHLWPFIVEARRNGAKFYTIDPVQNRTGRLADKHFGIHPGSDMALAFGLLHVIFGEGLDDRDYLERHTSDWQTLRARAAEYPPERTAALTGIPKDDIVDLAREYATVKPAAIRLNYGVQRSERGGNAVKVIAMLPAVTGSWREEGGGLQLSTSQAFQLNRAALEREDLQTKSPLGREARLVNMSELGKVLDTLESPRVHSLFVYNSNPAAIAPNQTLVRKGLAREDLFTIVIEQFQTDTADYADLLLPTTTFLEHTDIYFAYGHYYLQMARPALPAPGETKPNVEIFRLLAARMGIDDAALRASDDDMIRDLLNSDHPFIKGITLEQLEREHSVRLQVAPKGEPFLPFREGGFGGPDGRCNLDVSTIDYTPPIESRLGDEAIRLKYPLELISPKYDETMNSTFGYREQVNVETSKVHLHADDAAARDINSGDQVRVFNGRGSCLLRAEVDGMSRPGVATAPSIRWNKRAADGRNLNVLTSDRLTDIGGGPVFYSCLVQVEKCGD